MRVVVTGSSGKIGSFTASYLASRGFDVVTTSRRPRSVESVAEHRSADLRNADEAFATLVGADAVVHLAAIPAPGLAPNAVVFANNTQSTYNVLEAAGVLGVRRVVTASSIAVLGTAYAAMHAVSTPILYVPVDEDHPLFPIDAYGIAKQADELVCAALSRRNSTEIVALRLPWTTDSTDYGLLRAREELDAMSNTLWSYVDIRDAARAVELSLTATVGGFAAVYVTAADTLSECPSRELLRRFFSPGVAVRPGLEGTGTFFSNARAQELLGYTARHSWRANG